MRYQHKWQDADPKEIPPANQALLEGAHRQRGALLVLRQRVDAEGLEEAAQVRLDRVDAEEDLRGDLPGRRVVLRRQRVNAVAEPPRGHRKHATELPAAEHADRGPWTDDLGCHEN